MTATTRKPTIKRDGFRTYEVTGKSGNSAGYIQRVGTAGRGGWLLQMHSRPGEIYALLASAKSEALNQAERY